MITKLEESRRYMTPREKALKAKLVAYLKDDGKGHYHAMYAKRLDRFDLNIVYTVDEPGFTAAIDSDNGVVYIGEGFLTSKDKFYQLNVILRHEISHDVMKHMLRFAAQLGKKYGKKVYDKLAKSASFHDLLNIIADDEISNTRYTDEDKQIVRNMELGGKLIGGLVTEDHRTGWMNLSLEDMYKEAERELEALKADVAANSFASTFQRKANMKDPVKMSILRLLGQYTDENAESKLPISKQYPLGKWIENGCKIPNHYGKLTDINPDIKEIIETLYKELVSGIEDYFNISTIADVTKLNDYFKKWIQQITKSEPTKPCELINPLTGALVFNNKYALTTPEEKSLALNVIKRFFEEYAQIFVEIGNLIDQSKAQNKISDADLQELLDKYEV